MSESSTTRVGQASSQGPCVQSQSCMVSSQAHPNHTLDKKQFIICVSAINVKSSERCASAIFIYIYIYMYVYTLQEKTPYSRYLKSLMLHLSVRRCLIKKMSKMLDIFLLTDEARLVKYREYGVFSFIKQFRVISFVQLRK